MNEAEKVTPAEILKKAKGYALRLFKLRPRSEGELKAKLADKGYLPDIAGQVINEFKTYGYIDDAAFTRLWMQSRLKKYGFRRVSLELIQKGIAKEMITELWHELRIDHDEVAIAAAIATRRARQYQGVTPVKRKKRIIDYLLRRGFSSEAVSKATREI